MSQSIRSHHQPPLEISQPCLLHAPERLIFERTYANPSTEAIRQVCTAATVEDKVYGIEELTNTVRDIKKQQRKGRK